MVLLMYTHELRQFVTRLTTHKAVGPASVGNNEIPSEVYKFSSPLATADHDVTIPFRLYANW